MKPEITVGGRSIEVGKPNNYAITASVAIFALNRTDLIGYAAALGLCWESGTTTHAPAKFRLCKSDPQTYGEAVVNALHGRGVSAVEIIRAGAALTEWLAEDIVGEQEVVESVGNSPNPKEESAST